MAQKTEFRFDSYMDYEDGRMARLQTVDENKIPINVFIDNADDVNVSEKMSCYIDLQGVSSQLDVYHSEEELLEAGYGLAPVALIPMGTFPANDDDKDFEQSPHVLFTGKVLAVQKNPNASSNEPNYRVLVQTLGMTISIYARYSSSICIGDSVFCIAWLFGDMELV